MRTVCLSFLMVMGLFALGYADSLSVNSASVSTAQGSSVRQPLASDTTRTDLQSGLTSFGYATARVFGGVWHYLWKQMKSVLERVGRFLERVFGGENEGEKNLLRLPFSKRK